MVRFHDKVVWCLMTQLRLLGLPTAREVGVRDGRVDLVVLNGHKWAWLLEVKTTAAGVLNAPAQLRRYASVCGHEPQALTVVVAPEFASRELASAAHKESVDLWTCDFESLLERNWTAANPPRRTVVDLPYLGRLAA